MNNKVLIIKSNFELLNFSIMEQIINSLRKIFSERFEVEEIPPNDFDKILERLDKGDIGIVVMDEKLPFSEEINLRDAQRPFLRNYIEDIHTRFSSINIVVLTNQLGEREEKIEGVTYIPKGSLLDMKPDMSDKLLGLMNKERARTV